MYTTVVDRQGPMQWFIIQYQLLRQVRQKLQLQLLTHGSSKKSYYENIFELLQRQCLHVEIRRKNEYI